MEKDLFVDFKHVLNFLRPHLFVPIGQAFFDPSADPCRINHILVKLWIPRKHLRFHKTIKPFLCPRHHHLIRYTILATRNISPRHIHAFVLTQMNPRTTRKQPRHNYIQKPTLLYTHFVCSP